MKHFSACVLVLLVCMTWTARSTVFEASSSEDVDLFLKENDKETIGLLFFDSQTDNSKDEDWFSSLSSKILGIFMSHDQYGRSTEDWVEMFDDKLHLMRVDLRNPDNIRTKTEFNIEEAPFIVLQDKQRTVLREKINQDTYVHVRNILDKRPNMLHKTGGAALKSFSLEPDTNVTDSSPKVIQYFDLDEGEPTNVEQPIETQYVNWAPVDVIGPDGQWMERGRNWVTSYEIPESGIKNQEKNTKVALKDRIKDDPRPAQKPSGPAKPAEKAPAKPAEKTPAKPAEKTPAKPAEKTPAKPAATTPAKPAATTPAKPAATTPAKPVAAATKPALVASRPTATTGPVRPVASRPVTQGRLAATQSSPSAAKPVAQPAAKPATQPAAKPAAQPAAKPAAQPAAKPTAQPTGPVSATPQVHRYHDTAYRGYQSPYYKPQ